MKHKNIFISLVLFTSLFRISCGQGSEIIKSDSSWYKAGSMPESYKIGKDDTAKYNGESSFYLKSIDSVSGGFGTIMNGIEHTQFISKRVRLSGFIKTEKVDEWAGMWMRIDGPMPDKSLGFDNMSNRPILGTTGWQKYEIVLDVPENSIGIYYGVLISGNGQAWLANIYFEIVGDDVKSTNMLRD